MAFIGQQPAVLCLKTFTNRGFLNDKPVQRHTQGSGTPIDGKLKDGIKMHTMINAMEDLPSLARVSISAAHDHTLLKELELKKGFFVVFDKRYNDYRQYLQWSEGIVVEKDSRAIELRRVAFWDADKGKLYVFLSNNFLISPIGLPISISADVR